MPGLMFIGEAPSDEEVEGGFPLVGPSGRVFGMILRMAGIARTDAPPAHFHPDLETRRRGLRPMLWERSSHTITNVFDWKLADNDVSSVCAGAPVAKEGGFADHDFYIPAAGYLRPDYRGALDRLADEIRAAAPAVIVPLGATALWALTGSGAITESRGTVLRSSRLVPGVKLVPTLHPAHVIQDWRMLTVVVGDVVRAAREAADPTRIIHRGQRELWIEPSLDDLDMWWEERGSKSTLLSVDIETPRGQISCVGVGADAVSAICVPFIDWRQPHRSYWPTVDAELQAWEWVERVLARPTPKVLQNGSFDLFWLLREAGIKIANYRHDTRLMHHALYAELPKSLAFMGSSYGRPPGAWKTLRAGDEKRDA